MLDDTTNVADSPQLADRKATKMVDGVPTTGFFVSDFMFSELRELRVKQRLSTIRTQIYDNIFTIPTLDEIMSLAPSSFASTNREINQGKFENEQNFIKGKLKRKPLTSCRAAANTSFFGVFFPPPLLASPKSR